MQQKDIDHIIRAVKAPIDHPLFYPRIFALCAKQQRLKRDLDPISQLMAEEYDELSRRLDRSEIQESCSVRNVLRTRLLAQILIDEKGELDHSLLEQTIASLQNNVYSLGPQRQYDGKRQEHILKVLKMLRDNKDLALLLKKVTSPFSNKLGEDLIRQTLQLHSSEVVTDAHAKQAVLSAWLCYLRQNVGSCFATAPAGIIHDEQPEFFLQDMLEIIATGRLKRTFGGIENSVPLSVSWGSGDLKKPLLVRISTQGLSPELWLAPGLIAAFEAVGFLNPADKTSQKVKQLEGWIVSIFQNQHFTFKIVTAEEIIRRILMQSLGISEKQLQDFERRPRGMVQTRLMMHPTLTAKKSGGIGERCNNFLQLFELAKNIFKSYADNALLKAWEFTLASLSETKFEFTRWNLYASLGLGSSEVGGIGQCIYQTIQRKLDDANRKVQDTQYEYEAVYTQVKTLESRMRHASTEKEAQWLKVDYQSRANEFYFLEEQRNEAQRQAKTLVNLYDHLYSLYVDLFQEYFQEVYDADMHEVSSGPFDDSPAGFRLLYKHGRSNTSQWTLIYNQHEYVDALASFFVATEPHIAHTFEGRNIEKDLSEVVTAIINHVRTKEFLDTAFHRMAAAHQAPVVKDPLDHLDQIEKKPWAFTSGGTMNTLIGTYYRLEEKPAEAEKWFENEAELLVFLVDTMKKIPPSLLEPFRQGVRESMLIQSPTHAFILKPFLEPFKTAWSNEAYTYTYIRDHFIRPGELFVERLLLNEGMLRNLFEKLYLKVPENYQPRFKTLFGSMQGPLNPIFFRDSLVDLLNHDRGLRHGGRSVITPEEIDRLLYTNLPLFHSSELYDRIEKIMTLLPDITKDDINLAMDLLNKIPVSKGEHPYLGAQELQDICKALLCLIKSNTSTLHDYHWHVSKAAQHLGFAMPAPVIFADTNWIKDMFGFVTNPGTGKFELWRVDYTGSLGTPMSSWKQWVDGSRPDQKWAVYIKPYQYGQS